MPSTRSHSVEPAEGFLSVAELARRYRVSPSTVRRWLRQERLVCVRLPGGTYRIPLAAVEELEDRDEAGSGLQTSRTRRASQQAFAEGVTHMAQPSVQVQELI
jgi:excisionase family DNA binding protein